MGSYRSKFVHSACRSGAIARPCKGSSAGHLEGVIGFKVREKDITQNERHHSNRVFASLAKVSEWIESNYFAGEHERYLRKHLELPKLELSDKLNMKGQISNPLLSTERPKSDSRGNNSQKVKQERSAALYPGWITSRKANYFLQIDSQSLS